MAEYISREAAVEALRRYKVDPFDAGFLDDTIFGFTDGIDTAISELSVMPAADVRPVVNGKWIRGNESRTGPTKDSYICSVCGEKTLSGFCGNPAKTNFCPNCGADMREVKTDEK